MLPLTRKYQPKSSKDIQGQDKAIFQLRDFITNFKKIKKRSTIIYGPPGCGKTSSVYALANELNLELLEINASDCRNADQINAIIGVSSKQQSLFFKNKVILVDEIDGIAGNEDRGGVQALAKLIEETSYPIIITANDPFDKKFSLLRKKSEMIEFSQLAYTSVLSVLKRVCDEENIKCDDLTLKSLARRAGGDLRGALTDLQILSTHKEIKQENLDEIGTRRQLESMLQALVKVFKTTDTAVALTAFDNVDEEVDKIFLWIDENLSREYTNPEDLARAYEILSKADIFKGRIRRWQHWRYLSYVYQLLSAGIASAKDEKYKHFITYKPTTRLLKLYWANIRNAKKKQIAEKIANFTHSSAKKLVKDIDYFKVIFKNKDMANSIAKQLDLTKDEIEWLRN